MQTDTALFAYIQSLLIVYSYSLTATLKYIEKILKLDIGLVAFLYSQT